MRSRFQCWALCRQAVAHCCDIKTAIVARLVKFYGAPPRTQHSVRPTASTEGRDQWRNGCLELRGKSVGGFIELLASDSCESDFVCPGA